MKVKYVGDSKTVATVKGVETKIERGAELECMEKEYHSATFVRVLMPSGDHVKVKRSELQKV